MGKMETESRSRAKRNQLKKIVLETIKAVGILGVGLIAPNVVGAMVKIGLLEHPRRKELIHRSIDRLYAQGLLKHAHGGLMLTEKGLKALLALELKSFQGKKPSSWDGKWRVLIFDIPEEQRKLRDDIRRTLISNGFIRIQDSVWVYPYECEDWVNLWKAELKVGKELLYLIVDSIEGDSLLKRRFDL